MKKNEVLYSFLKQVITQFSPAFYSGTTLKMP
jgi:hypothetical protein